jgi:hypothetical protein
MAIYDFRCMKCDHIDENVSMPITHMREDLPWHCGQRMSYHISQPPSVHWKDPVIEPFRAIATKDRPIITTLKQNREYMAKHDLIDANDFGPPPSHLDQARDNAEMQRSIDAVTPTGEVAAKMAEQGLDKIVGED